MNILITDGDNRASLALTRALGERHRVTVGSAHHPSLASVSRFCHDAFTYPNPARQEESFLGVLEDTVRERKIDVLIPVTDITAFVVAEHRQRFEPACRLPLPPLATLRLGADKAAIVRLADGIGVPVPKSMYVEHPGDPLPALHAVPFPLVVKPARSRVRTAKGWVSTAVSYARDRNDLVAMLEALPAEAYPILLQERVPGEGMGIFACYDRGRCIALFSHRRIREKPPSGGVSVLRESVALPPDASRYATQLLDHLRWHGVAMVEFKRDARDGVPRLMEINGRFWGSLQLAIDAGLDFPGLLLGIGNGISPQSPPYRVGVRSRWLWGDMDALLMTLFKREEREKLPADQRSRLRALARFCHFFEPDTRLEILRRDDLRPWLLETVRWFRRG